MPFYLIQGRGLNPAEAGLLLTAQPVLMAITAPISGAFFRQVRLARSGNARYGCAGRGLVFAVWYWAGDGAVADNARAGRCRFRHGHVYLAEYQRIDGGGAQVPAGGRIGSPGKRRAISAWCLELALPGPFSPLT